MEHRRAEKRVQPRLPLVKPLGRVALALLVYGGAAMAIFDRWAERAVDRRLERTALV